MTIVFWKVQVYKVGDLWSGSLKCSREIIIVKFIWSFSHEISHAKSASTILLQQNTPNSWLVLNAPNFVDLAPVGGNTCRTCHTAVRLNTYHSQYHQTSIMDQPLMETWVWYTQLKQDNPWDERYYYMYWLYDCVDHVELSILSLNCITGDKGPCKIVACVTVSVVTGIGSVVSWGQSLRGMGTDIRARPSPSDISERLVDQYYF